MEGTFKQEPTPDEATQFSALVNECVSELERSHERMLQHQKEIDRLKAETKAIRARTLAVLDEIKAQR